MGEVAKDERGGQAAGKREEQSAVWHLCMVLKVTRRAAAGGDSSR
jgi:hypothetical protein